MFLCAHYAWHCVYTILKVTGSCKDVIVMYLDRITAQHPPLIKLVVAFDNLIHVHKIFSSQLVIRASLRDLWQKVTPLSCVMQTNYYSPVSA